MNGHKFVQRQFYQIILCAFCNEFLLNAVGYQCEDCRYTCHKKCYEKVVTKCISKSNTGVSTQSVPALYLYLMVSYRMTMPRRSTIVFLTGSSLSPILVLTGAAIVVICCLWVARMLAGVPSATSHVMQTVLTLFPTSVVCQWRQRICSCAIGGISTGRGELACSNSRERFLKATLPTLALQPFPNLQQIT
jgi:hypothetical protein